MINVNVQPSLFSLHDAMFAPPSSSVSLPEEEPSPSLCKLSFSTANSWNQWSFKPHWLEFSSSHPSSHLLPMCIYLLRQCWVEVCWPLSRYQLESLHAWYAEVVLSCMEAAGWDLYCALGWCCYRGLQTFLSTLQHELHPQTWTMTSHTKHTCVEVFNFNNVAGTSHNKSCVMQENVISPDFTGGHFENDITW